MFGNVITPDRPIGIGKLSNHDILFERQIAAIDKLKTVSDDEFEDIIREWIWGYVIKNHSSGYVDCKKCAGSGDMGRDVIAIVSKEKYQWHNFQCKNYRIKLSPAHIWLEIGKVIYYSYKKEFSLPSAYYFVAPLGPGPDLIKYFADPETLKKLFMENWDAYCSDKLIPKTKLTLSGPLLDYVHAADFSIFDSLDPQKLIDEHAQTRYHYSRFGGSMPDRIFSKGVPKKLHDKEMVYVNELLDAYSDHKKATITIKNIEGDYIYYPHFNRQRESFYLADSLYEFSKDTFPEYTNHFQTLKKEVHSGVVDICESDFPDSYARVKAVTQEAKRINLTSNPLVKFLNIQDREGICHHLVNDDMLTWKGNTK